MAHAATVSLPIDNPPTMRKAAWLPKVGVPIGVVLVAVAAVIAAATGEGGWDRFWHAYIFGFMFVLSFAIGALFFVAIQHLVRAGWSVVVRRFAELLAMMVVPLFVAWLPIAGAALFGDGTPYPWTNDEAMATNELYQHKAPYLNKPFFLIRGLAYFGFWAFAANYYLKKSRQQDETGDKGITITLEKRSAVIIPLLALTATFAAIDWMMTLAPTWYSTIYGVYFFAASQVAFYAAAAIWAVRVHRKKAWRGIITKEHLHDLGKLLFGFNCFWAYIAFSQYLLIWYANIPEETEFYQPRYNDGWQWFSVFLIAGHFIIPFLGLLSRHVKRNPMGLLFWAFWLIVMTAADFYWLVMPFLSHGGDGLPAFSLMDPIMLAGFVLIGLGLARFAIGDKPMLPYKDPRLEESLAFHNI